MNGAELSKRLRMVAEMVEPGSVVADVGCDHSYTSIWLVQKGISPRVFAMDVNEGPLERAAQHVREAGLEDRILLRLSDGLKGLQMTEDGPEADTLLIAGLGGRLASRILLDSAGKVQGMRWLVIQPQSEPALVRKTLVDLGFRIEAEDMTLDEGKYYTVIKAVNSRMSGGKEAFRIPAVLSEEDGSWQRAALLYGPCLLSGAHPVLGEYLRECLRKNRAICAGISREGGTESAAERRRELEEEEALLVRCLALYQS